MEIRFKQIAVSFNQHGADIMYGLGEDGKVYVEETKRNSDLSIEVDKDNVRQIGWRLLRPMKILN